DLTSNCSRLHDYVWMHLHARNASLAVCPRPAGGSNPCTHYISRRRQPTKSYGGLDLPGDDTAAPCARIRQNVVELFGSMGLQRFGLAFAVRWWYGFVRTGRFFCLRLRQ